MSKRSRAQKIGAQGSAWLLSSIEEHPNWLARGLGEDYGIDAEAELAIDGVVRGEILKIQIKTMERVHRKGGRVRVQIDRKYLEIANASRYPVVLALVGLEPRGAWYLWLQDWLLKHRGDVRFSSKKKYWTHWLQDSHTMGNGLDGELQEIARWQGETQFVLSLLDASRAALFTGNDAAARALEDILHANRELLAGSRLIGVIDEMISIGDGIRTTAQGHQLTRVLFDLVRRYGDELSSENIRELVVRQVTDDGATADTYSRTGLDVLSVLYDTFPDSVSSMGLPERFAPVDPRVAYFCAWREAFPTDSEGFGRHPEDFEFAGLRFELSGRFHDNEANRGKSAILDHLVPAD